MTKAEIVSEIAAKTGLEKQVVLTVVEGMMDTIKTSMINGNEVFLRGFGSFIIKHRAEKTARKSTARPPMPAAMSPRTLWPQAWLLVARFRSLTPLAWLNRSM